MLENTLTGYQARAGPNQALRREVGIGNAFTNEDNTAIRKITALATKQRILHGTDWEGVVTLAATALESLAFFKQIGNAGTVPIPPPAPSSRYRSMSSQR